jgi:hypothetical protein
MPLTRGEIVGYDAGGMFYKFTMKNGVHAVDCEISNVALSDLVGGRWATLQVPDREVQFLRFREQIESIASKLFDADLSKPKLVRIFAKHLSREKNSPR